MVDGKPYRNRLRLRISGLLVEDDAILLAQIHSPVTGSLVWMPPGGGLEFGESIERCLKREFREETGLDIEVHTFEFVHELVKPPFHAVELFYRVKKLGGELQLGSDPEHDPQHQLIKDIQWIPIKSISSYPIAPKRLLAWIDECF